MFTGYCIAKASIRRALSFFLVDDVKKQRFERTKKTLDIKAGNITNNIASIIQGDKDGVIDGESLRQACLPTGTDKFDIFISHSHSDKDIAQSLAAFLHMKFGLKCFVDSFVWGSCDRDILRPIDDIWSRHDTKNGSFSYEKRNFSTSHVHSMLSMSLLEMMDLCECCIFIKPENDYVIKGIEMCTLSPWIYEEICFFNKIRKNRPNRTTRCAESFSAGERELSIRYNLDLSNMPEIETTHLLHVFNTSLAPSSYTIASRWLDYLYENVFSTV